jgi:hypothetical protein
MTSYIRFLHIETHHLPFILIEVLVTITTLCIFAVVPADRFAFFPNKVFRNLSIKRARACLVVFLLSIFGRIALLPLEPFPPPRVQDEFSYLLASETFAHGRLTNPTPPQWHHFEAFHVLLRPTYMSKYGPAPPLFMAFSEFFLGTPRFGVLLSMALAAAILLDASRISTAGMGLAGRTAGSRPHQLVQLLRQRILGWFCRNVRRLSPSGRCS